MGGLAKAEVLLGNQRLVDRCIERLEPQVHGLALNTNTPVGTDIDVVADVMPGHLGPLAGVHAGLHWAQSKGQSHIVTVAVDTPFFPCDLVPQLLMAAGGGLTIAATSDGLHGTFGLWPVALLTPLTAFLEEGGRKVRAFTDAQNAAVALFPDTTPTPFFNINTPDDLAQAEAWM